MQQGSNLSVTQSAGPTPETWTLQHAKIKRLYLDKDNTLSQVMEIMKRDYDFTATVKMYKRQLKLWKIDSKNLKRPHVKQIARQKVERDAAGKPSQFFIKSRNVDMENIQRYLRKHEFSSLEEFAQAVSPAPYSSDVMCTTPGASPAVFGVEDVEMDVENITPKEYPTCIAHHQSSSKLMTIIDRHRSSTSRNIDLRHFVSLSPEARWQRLLCLSPVPRTAALPTAMRLPDQILATFNVYLKGSFEAGIWKTQTSGYLESNKSRTASAAGRWVSNCFSATVLIRKRSFVQARQVLSQMCTGMEPDITSQYPDFIRDFTKAVMHFHLEELPELAALISRHAIQIATQHLGNNHPVTQMCGMLLDLGAISHQFRARLIQCALDNLEEALGSWHHNITNALYDLIQAVEASEAVDRSRARLAAYEKMSTKKDGGWFECMDMLSRAYLCNGQYADVEKIARNALDAVAEKLSGSSAQYYSIGLFEILRDVTLAKGDSIVKAEGFARQTVVKAGAFWGWQNPVTIRYMLYDAELLRGLGKLDEVCEIETYIQDHLGPPEILELLE